MLIISVSGFFLVSIFRSRIFYDCRSPAFSNLSLLSSIFLFLLFPPLLFVVHFPFPSFSIPVFLSIIFLSCIFHPPIFVCPDWFFLHFQSTHLKFCYFKSHMFHIS